MYIDYDGSESAVVSDYQYFGWNFSTNYTQADSAIKFVVVDFDSIHDRDADIGYPYSQVDDIQIDTVFVALGHINTSGMNDTFIVDVVALDNTGYPTYHGGTGGYSQVTLWSDTLVTATTLTGPSWLNFGGFAFVPDPGSLVVSPPDGFGVQVRYYGPAQDSAGFLAGYTNAGTCTNFGIATSAYQTLFFDSVTVSGNKRLRPNSYYHYTYFPQPLYPTPTNGIIYIDCNGSGDYDKGVNEEWYLQNIAIWVNATVYHHVGIGEAEADFNVSLYPNPANDMVHLSVEALDATTYTITITNIEGAVVRTESVSGSRVNHNIQVGDLSNGLYLVRINDGTSIVSRPLVVNR